MIIIQKKENPAISLLNDPIHLIPTDLIETNEMVQLIMDLPGIKKEEIQITYQDNLLAVNANLKKEQANYLLEERTKKNWQRFIELAEIDLDSMEAKLENGVLTIQVLKKVQPVHQIKQIQIN